MTMDYNKWGVVTGMVGFILLFGWWISRYYVYTLFNLSFATLNALSVVLALLFSLFGLTTLILGILSFIKEKKKSAFLLGLIYAIFGLIYGILLIYFVILRIASS